jgi:hypothetical protein
MTYSSHYIRDLSSLALYNSCTWAVSAATRFIIETPANGGGGVYHQIARHFFKCINFSLAAVVTIALYYT